MSFAGRHVVITGATGGLGGAVVSLLVERGAVVHVPMVEAAAPPALVRSGVHTTPGVDLGDEAAVARFFHGVPAVWGSIHLVGGFAMSAIAEATVADLDKMMAINVRTCFVCCREAVAAMRRAGGGGRIVNTTARAAVAPGGGMVPYVASKAAVVGITLGLAAEVIGDNILVNAIAPSIIDTPANRAAMPDADFARWPKPAELAETIAYLVSPDNRLTSGTVVPVYGRA